MLANLKYFDKIQFHDLLQQRIPFNPEVLKSAINTTVTSLEGTVLPVLTSRFYGP